MVDGRGMKDYKEQITPHSFPFSCFNVPTVPLIASFPLHPHYPLSLCHCDPPLGGEAISLKNMNKFNNIEEVGFDIKKTYRVFENPYHRFIILKKVNKI